MDIRNWFTVRIKYHKIDEHGKVKKVNEPYLVDAVSFTEAEARITYEMGAYISGDFYVSNISKINIAEVFHFEDADVWYKVKAGYVDFDEESGREKKVSNTFMVTATDAREAFDRVKENLSGMLVEFEITSIMKTNILEVFPYIPGDHNSPSAQKPSMTVDEMMETATAFGKLAQSFNAVNNEDEEESDVALDEMNEMPESNDDEAETDATSDEEEPVEETEEKEGE